METIYFPSGAQDVGGAPRFRRAVVLGGARSGKSATAERLLARSSDRVYLATAEARDAEMAERIARHRAARGEGWETAEAPLELPAALAAVDRPGRAVLVDCLTLWLTNLMLAGRDVEAETSALTEALDALAADAVLVSNEVGMGIVPENALARRFRDAQGRLNQRMAAGADLVLFVAAGLPLVLRAPS